MEYLKYFLNKTSAEGYKVLQNFVGYLGEEDKVLYSKGGEVIKDGEMVMDEPDPAPGFVDLGLSVMWASCNLGASSPEETGLYYRFGEAQGHAKDSGVFDDDYHCPTTDWSQCDDPVFSNALMPNKDILSPHVPTREEVLELVANTTQTFETIGTIKGIRFTASNGNSIFMPICGFIQSNDSHLEEWFAYWSSTFVTVGLTYDRPVFAGALYAQPDETAYYSSSDHYAHRGMPVRGVCNYAPKHRVLKYGDSVELQKGDNYFALMRDDITDTTFTVNTINALSIAGLDDLTDETLNTIHTEKSFNTNGDCSELQLTSYEMNQHAAEQLRLLPKPITNNKGIYQYVKITCEENCTLSVTRWDLSGYLEKYFDSTALITNGVRFYLPLSSSSTFYYYRLKYNDWKDGDMLLNWEGDYRLPIYISNTCGYFLSSTHSSVVKYSRIKAESIETYPQLTIESWADRVDADGYLYIRFNTTDTEGYITFTSTEPTTT